MAVAIDREVLEQRHAEAKRAEEVAFTECNRLGKEVRRIEKDIADKQRWLKAFRGEDEQLRNKLLDSVEFLTFDPVAAEREVLSLYGKLRDARAQHKEAGDKYEQAKRAEHKAFYELQRHKQQAAVIESLKAELALGEHLRAEKEAREAVCVRELAEVGSLPVLTRVDLGSFDHTYSESAICHRFRSAIAVGYVNGREDWIVAAGVKWDRNQ